MGIIVLFGILVIASIGLYIKTSMIAFLVLLGLSFLTGCLFSKMAGLFCALSWVLIFGIFYTIPYTITFTNMLMVVIISMFAIYLSAIRLDQTVEG